MKNKTSKSTNLQSRDYNIQKCSTGELNLSTKSIKDKTKYSRKEKHKLREI